MNKTIYFLSCAFLSLFLGFSFSSLFATKDMFKEARDKVGKEVRTCRHCHAKALPKEGDSELNERGEWLMKEQERREAKEIDVAWLKEYKEEK